MRAFVSIISAKAAGSIFSTGAIGEAAGQMDRGPKIRNTGIERIDRGRIGEIDIVRQPDAVIAGEGEMRRRGGMAFGTWQTAPSSSSRATTAPPSAPVPPVTTICLPSRSLRHVQPSFNLLPHDLPRL